MAERPTPRCLELPPGASVLVGSLPHRSLPAALDLSVRAAPHLPSVPELPALDPRWALVPSALWGVTGVEVRPDGTWEVGDPDGSSILPHDHPVRSAAAGLIERLHRPGPVKLQTAGPVTLHMAGLALDVAVEVVLARIRQLAALVDEAVVVIDEPSLVVLMRHEPPVADTSAAEVLAEVGHRSPVPIGIHCCGPTRWEVVVSGRFALVSVPAALADEALIGATHGGTLMAWGVVPTTGLIPSAVEQLAAVRRANAQLGVEDHLVSPECGLAGGTEQRAAEVVSALLDGTARR